MKKSTLLKMALTLAGAFVFVGANAQTPLQYVIYDSTAVAPANIDYVTVGSKLGYYVDPDPVYHPDYDTDGSLTGGFTWTWATASTSANTPTYSGALNNYVEITYPDLGNYKILVRENAPAAYGGCTGGWIALNVTAVDAPTAQFTNTGSTNTCGNLGATNIVVQITENVPASLAAYAFTVNETVELLDGDDNVVYTSTATTAAYAFTTAAKFKSTHAAWGGSQPDYTLTFSRNLNVLTWAVADGGDNKQYRTKYTYELITPAAATAGTGIVSAISQKSEFLNTGEITAHAFSGTNPLVYIVNPNPTTGPIYHIPNTYAY